jgi:hypothetical protein
MRHVRVPRGAESSLMAHIFPVGCELERDVKTDGDTLSLILHLFIYLHFFIACEHVKCSLLSESALKV